MTLQEILKEYKRQTNISNNIIANKVGVSESTVSRWISGDIKKIQDHVVDALSDLMGFDVNELLNKNSFTFEKPILGSAKAGYDMYLQENYLGYQEVNKEDFQRGDYFLKVVGDSMVGAKIHDGDLVYVQQCDDIPSGKIAVVQVGDEVTIKKVIKKSDMFILEAANTNVENRYFTKQEVEQLPVRIIGKVLYSKTEF